MWIAIFIFVMLVVVVACVYIIPSRAEREISRMIEEKDE